MFKKDWQKKTFSFLAVRIIRIVMLIVFFSLFMTIVLIGAHSHKEVLFEGDVAMRSAYAPFDFTYLGEVDEDLTNKAKEAVRAEVLPVYRLDLSRKKESVDKVSKFLEDAALIQKDETISEEGRLVALKDIRSSLQDATLRVILEAEDFNAFSDGVRNVLEKVLVLPVISEDKLKSLREKGVGTVSLQSPAGSEESTTGTNQLLSMDRANKRVLTIAGEYFTDDQKLKAVAAELAKEALSANVEEDAEEYNKRKEQAAKYVDAVRKEVRVKENEIIIEKGKRATKAHLTKLNQLTKLQEKTNRYIYIVGLALLAVLFLALGLFYLIKYESKIFSDNKNLLLVGSIVLLQIFLARIITLSPLSSYLIPVSCSGMLLAVLLNANVAFAAVIAISMFTGIMAGGSLNVAMVSLIGSCVGIYSVKGLSKRSHLLKAGLWVGMISFITIVGIGLLNNLKPAVFIVEGIWGFGSGILAVFIVAGALPVFESLFKITTNITLLELLDLNHPLLKELILKAPGTYHHSLIVGNLAESACRSIGANALLARVGAYYHDVGKMIKPEYFSENEVDYKSRHDKLAPTMSSLIITNHAKDGVELARKHKLSDTIVDFIQQHHGTSLTFYFYQRALEKDQGGKGPKEEDFRYPGPLPQTKETAVVMLADAVEASSRTLSEPTPARIESLVQKIINNKFIDGQLNECELSLVDLHEISESFVKILTGMFHSRIEYPEQKEEE